MSSPSLFRGRNIFSPFVFFSAPSRTHTKRPRARFSFPGRSQTSSLAFPQKKIEQYRKDKTYFKYAAFLGEMNLEKRGNVYPPFHCFPLAVGGRSHLPPFCMRRREKNLINAFRETVFPPPPTSLPWYPGVRGKSVMLFRRGKCILGSKRGKGKEEEKGTDSHPTFPPRLAIPKPPPHNFSFPPCKDANAPVSSLFFTSSLPCCNICEIARVEKEEAFSPFLLASLRKRSFFYTRRPPNLAKKELTSRSHLYAFFCPFCLLPRNSPTSYTEQTLSLCSGMPRFVFAYLSGRWCPGWTG